MIKKYYNLIILGLLLILVTLLSMASPTLKKNIFRGKAAANELTIKIQLQGEYDKIPTPSYKTKVVFYTANGVYRQFDNLPLTKVTKNFYNLVVDTSQFDYAKFYAVYIKPDKFLGRLFCSSSIYGNSCTTPQLVVLSGSNSLDLSQNLFFSGDISPQDGKISAYDMSTIIAAIGQTNDQYLKEDINSDHKVEAVDYSLALFSLSQNVIDDPIPASFSPTISPTTSVTNQPTPTASAQADAGTCNVSVNGQLYINYNYGLVSGTQCQQLTNDLGHYCVNTLADCDSTTCVNTFINQIKLSLPLYASTCNVTLSLDEVKTRSSLSCQTSFVGGNCTPQPTPTISCSSGGTQSCQ